MSDAENLMSGPPAGWVQDSEGRWSPPADTPQPQDEALRERVRRLIGDCIAAAPFAYAGLDDATDAVIPLVAKAQRDAIADRAAQLPNGLIGDEAIRSLPLISEEGATRGN